MDTTIEKAFLILEQIAQGDEPVGVTELGRKLNLTKSNTHRILSTLVALGYAVNESDQGRYRATLKLWEIGTRVRARLTLWRAAQAHLRSLHKETGETVYLTIPVGNEVLYIDKHEADYPIRASSLVGVRTPMYCTAAGKIMLAYFPPHVVEQALVDLRPLTEYTTTDPDLLRADFEESRRRGYAISEGELRPGLNGVGAAILDRGEAVIGAVAVAGPAERMTRETLDKYALLVMNAATRISESL